MIDTLRLKEAIEKEDAGLMADTIGQYTKDLRDDFRNEFATKADLYKALGIQTFAIISAMVALVKIL